MNETNVTNVTGVTPRSTAFLPVCPKDRPACLSTDKSVQRTGLPVCQQTSLSKGQACLFVNRQVCPSVCLTDRQTGRQAGCASSSTFPSVRRTGPSVRRTSRSSTKTSNQSPEDESDKRDGREGAAVRSKANWFSYHRLYTPGSTPSAGRSGSQKLFGSQHSGRLSTERLKYSIHQRSRNTRRAVQDGLPSSLNILRL